jgi:hypothetical protein
MRSLYILSYVCYFQKYKTVEFCHGDQKLVSFALLSSYKLFPATVNNMNVVRSSCEVADSFVLQKPHLGFLNRFS